MSQWNKNVVGHKHEIFGAHSGKQAWQYFLFICFSFLEWKWIGFEMARKCGHKVEEKMFADFLISHINSYHSQIISYQNLTVFETSIWKCLLKNHHFQILFIVFRWHNILFRILSVIYSKSFINKVLSLSWFYGFAFIYTLFFF